MQVVSVYPHLFCYNLLLKCALQPKIVKKSLKPPILRFKIVQNHKCKKLVACYDEQHVCLSATIFTLDEPMAEK